VSCVGSTRPSSRHSSERPHEPTSTTHRRRITTPTRRANYGAGQFQARLCRLSKGVYRWVEHTGELELQIDAPTEQGVFADAFAAFAEVVADGGGGDADRRDIALEPASPEVMLADWLNELVYLADADEFVPTRLAGLELEDGGLRATVHGHRGVPTPLIKAASLHGLECRPTPEGGWQARVVLDV
jgi:SHS2 domain-containing protein